MEEKYPCGTGVVSDFHLERNGYDMFVTIYVKTLKYVCLGCMWTLFILMWNAQFLYSIFKIFFIVCIS